MFGHILSCSFRLASGQEIHVGRLISQPSQVLDDVGRLMLTAWPEVYEDMGYHSLEDVVGEWRRDGKAYDEGKITAPMMFVAMAGCAQIFLCCSLPSGNVPRLRCWSTQISDFYD